MEWTIYPDVAIVSCFIKSGKFNGSKQAVYIINNYVYICVSVFSLIVIYWQIKPLKLAIRITHYENKGNEIVSLGHIYLLDTNYLFIIDFWYQY